MANDMKDYKLMLEIEYFFDFHKAVNVTLLAECSYLSARMLGFLLMELLTAKPEHLTESIGFNYSPNETDPDFRHRNEEGNFLTHELFYDNIKRLDMVICGKAEGEVERYNHKTFRDTAHKKMRAPITCVEDIIQHLQASPGWTVTTPSDLPTPEVN